MSEVIKLDLNSPPAEDVIINEDDRIHIRIQRLPGNPQKSTLVLENDGSFLVDLKIESR